MKNPDPDAIAIGELYRKARSDDAPRKARNDEDTKPRQSSVTPIRLISGKLSGSRNGRNTRDDNWGRSIDANVCHWCDERFKPGQMRYPIMTDCSLGWSAVSVCMECFKQASPEETGERQPEIIDANRPNWAPPPKPHCWASPRREMKCPGCGEPIFTAPDFRSMRLHVCSARCYQRVYRRRRHQSGSTIPWKFGPPRREICEACKRPLPDGLRRDGRFCSNRCRQWAYRRRHQANPS